MRIDKLEDLKFAKSAMAFKDKSQLFTAFHRGKLSRADIQKKMRMLADKLKDANKNAYIGVSAHYEHPNAFLPAIYNEVSSEQMKLYDPSDSITSKGFSTIDGAYFYIIEMEEGKKLQQKMHKTKKTESMFAQHKKKGLKKT